MFFLLIETAVFTMGKTNQKKKKNKKQKTKNKKPKNFYCQQAQIARFTKTCLWTFSELSKDTWDTLYHSVRKSVRGECSMNIDCHKCCYSYQGIWIFRRLPKKKLKLSCNFRKLKIMTKADVVMKRKTNRYVLCKFEAVTIQLSLGENTFFAIRPQFPSSQKSLSLQFNKS